MSKNNTRGDVKNLNIALKGSNAGTKPQYVQGNYYKNHPLKSYKAQPYQGSPSDLDFYPIKKMSISKSKSRTKNIEDKYVTPSKDSNTQMHKDGQDYSKRLNSLTRKESPSKSPAPSIEQVVTQIKDLLDDSNDKEIRVGFLDRNKRKCSSCKTGQENTLKLEKNEWLKFGLEYKKDHNLDVYVRKLDFSNTNYIGESLPHFLRIIKDKFKEKNDIIENLKQTPQASAEDPEQMKEQKDLIADLSAKVNMLEKENQRLKDELANGVQPSEDLESLQKQLQAQNIKLRRLKDDNNTLTDENKLLKQKIDLLENKFDDIDFDNNALKDSNEKLLEELKKLEQAFAAEKASANKARQQIKEKNQYIETLEAQLKSGTSNDPGDLQKRIHEYASEVDSLLSQIDDKDKSNFDLNKLKDEHLGIIEGLKKELNSKPGTDNSREYLEKIKGLEQQIEELTNQKNKEIQILKDENDRAKKEVMLWSKAQSEISRLKDDLKKLKDENSLAQNEIKDLKEKLSNTNDEIKKGKEENDLAQKEIERLKEELSNFQDEIQKANEEIARLNVILENSDRKKFEDEIASLKKDITKRDEKIEQIKLDYNKYREENADTFSGSARKDKYIDLLEKEIRELKKVLATQKFELTEEVSMKDMRIGALERTGDDLSNSLTAAKKQHKEDLQERKYKIHELEKQLAAANKLVKNKDKQQAYKDIADKDEKQSPDPKI